MGPIKSSILSELLIFFNEIHIVHKYPFWISKLFYNLIHNNFFRIEPTNVCIFELHQDH